MDPSPALLHIAAQEVDSSSTLAHWVTEIRAHADRFIVLGGGASKMREPQTRQLQHLLDALSRLARTEMRLAVVDGGTRAGVMEAAGAARRASGNAFPLVGVAPGPEITASGQEGKTPIDPNHSHIVAVDNQAWEAAQGARGWKPSDGYWGSETGTMFRLFAQLADGRPSAALVANGGAVTLDEVRESIDARRPIVLIAGSGRAADTLVSLVKGLPPEDDPEQLRAHAEALGLPGARLDLYHIVDLASGPEALCQLLRRLLAPPD